MKNKEMNPIHVMNKQELRKSIQAKRKVLSDSYQKDASQKILSYILQSDAYKKAQTLFIFVSMKGEVNTHPLIEQAWKDGKTVVVPRCESKGIMHAYQIQSWKDVQPRTWGILEPVDTTTYIPVHQIDLAIVPCCTCNEKGQRLGFGGGFYDRYLEHQSMIKMMVCFHELMCEEIPVDDHDIVMDMIVSEVGINNKKQ